MRDPRELYPGPIPQDETVLPPDPAFIEECMSALAADAEQFGWRFGKSVLSCSEKWGMIWRVDIHTRDERHVVRMAIWRPPGETEGFGTAYFGRPAEPFK